MKSKNNKICVICNKAYHYCPSCSHDSDKPSWYAVFDSDNCHSIYDVCIGYRDGKYDKKSAYEILKTLDIVDYKNYKESTRKQIENILSYENEINKTVEVNIVDDVNEHVDNVEEPKVEVNYEYKPKFRNRQNNYVKKNV